MQRSLDLYAGPSATPAPLATVEAPAFKRYVNGFDYAPKVVLCQKCKQIKPGGSYHIQRFPLPYVLCLGCYYNAQGVAAAPDYIAAGILNCGTDRRIGEKGV